MPKPMWMVRAGEEGYLADEFQSKSVVAIGGTEGNTDWTKFQNRDSIKAKLAEENPEKSDGQNFVAANQIERFMRGLSVGDRVITYNPATRQYSVGTIKSAVKHDPTVVADLPLYRNVEWQGHVLRDALSVPTRNSLGAISTLFCVPESGAAEMEAALEGKALTTASEAEPIEDETDLLKDVQARSHEFIKDRLSKLDWDQMQSVVAGLLRAMGYKTRISPAGADRGKDIIASPDGFGFEPPRIVVEVKHRKGSMGSQEIRSFLGGRHKDDKGLYVSTGGFSKDAQYEADRSSIPLTLMDGDELARAVAEYYDRMDSETKSMLPLVRIYWPK